jgi:hypothetical protein
MNQDIIRTSRTLPLGRMKITQRLVITRLRTFSHLCREQSGHLPDISFSALA